MGEDGDDESKGGRRKVVTDEKILRIIAEADDPVLSAPEVTDNLPISNAGVNKRLNELQEEGLLGSKKIGPGRAWWITEDGREFLDADD